MSINALTEVEVRRPLRRANRVGREEATPGGGANTPGEGGTPSPAGNALGMLIKYIPTESITLYVAAASAMPVLQQFVSENQVYLFFGLLTPVLFALILIGKRKSAGVTPVATLKDWPWWKTFAATIAFLVWALAVPGKPDVPNDSSGALAAFLAIFISTLLSLLEPIFDRPPARDGA